MKQSKRHTHYEVLTNQVLGIAYGWMVVFFIFPYLSGMSQAGLATVSSVIFFIGSYLRAYGVRRWYEHMKHKETDERPTRTTGSTLPE